MPDLDGKGLLAPPPEKLVQLVVELLRLGNALAVSCLPVLVPKVDKLKSKAAACIDILYILGNDKLTKY